MLRPRVLAGSLVARVARVALGAAFCVAALGSTGGEARAGAPTEAEISQARARFAEGRKLEDAGRWPEALSVFQRVAEVKMTPQIRFHIALCLEHVGMWTQALEGYAQAADEAGAAVPEVVKEANEHRQQLEGTLPTVTLRVAGAAPGDELLLDRRPLPIDEGAPPMRVDPGPHTAELRRGGAVVAREIFAVEPATARRVDLRVGVVALEHPGERPSASSEDLPGAPRGRVQRAIGWTAIGVGATSAVLTGVFIGLRGSAMSRLDADCPTLTRCPASAAPIVSEGKTDAALVNVFGVVGGVAAAAGVVLLVLAPPRSPAPARARISASGSPATAWIELCGDGTLGLRGSFR